MNESLQLTDEQRQLVETPANAHMLVTAPAGSGKTLSLTRRLSYLVDEAGLEPSELLVLSFTRAAVREVCRRLVAFGGDAAHVEVRTFDSYATWLLSEVAPDGPWQNQDFDARIRAATRLITQDPAAKELAGMVRHLVVDEVQDLVGDRAALVRTLLDCDLDGFTLLGDPAQGIYGFQLNEPNERLAGAAQLYAQIRHRFREDLLETTLTGNFRVRESDARQALSFGEALGAVNAPFADLQRGLRTTLLSGDSLGTLEQAAPVISRMTAATAILCRTNHEVLLVSRRLYELDVLHHVQRFAQDTIIPAWVGTLYRDLDIKQPSKSAVLDVLGTTDVDPHAAWDLLRRLDRSRRSDTLDLVAVRRRLAEGGVLDDLTQQTGRTLVVSTIHQVKGLEFDHVVVVDPGDAPDDDPIEQAERARLLYVAMTRARDMVIHIKPIGRLAAGYLDRQRDGRLAELGFKKGHHLGLEIRPDDVASEQPAGTVGFHADPRDAQTYLASTVGNGDPITLVRLSPSASEDFPRYVVQHRERYIGATSESFGAALKSLLPGRDRRLPSRITGLHVDNVETVIGRQAAGINGGLGWSGIWLRPRIMGLGRFDWTEE